MYLVKFLVMIAVAIFLCASLPARCEELIIVTEDYPPLNYIENEVLVGPSVEIVKAIQKDLNNKVDIAIMPWARGYTLTEK